MRPRVGELTSLSVRVADEADPAPAALQDLLVLADDAVDQPPPFTLRMISTAGPRRISQRVGKMQPTIGSIIFSDACSASSSARWRRLRRISSDCTRRILARPTALCSDSITA